MSSINNVTLLGNVGNDIIFRTTQDGRKVCNFSIATNESYKDEEDNWKQFTSWHKITVFNQGAVRYLEKTLSKGNRVFISGTLYNKKYTDKDGKDHYTTEVAVRNYSGNILTGKDLPPETHDSYYENNEEFLG